MAPVQKPQSKRPGGKAAAKQAQAAENVAEIPLERPPAEFGVVHGGKTLVVRDEKGQIVSVTHVARDTPYGVGVRPAPGHVVKELEQSEDLRDAVGPLKSSQPRQGNKAKHG